MRSIKTAWVNDPVGSLGRTSTEEMIEDRDMLARSLGYEIDVTKHANSMADVQGQHFDLLVFDYGGAANSYGKSAWDEFDAVIAWAEDHPGTLVLIYSSFSGNMYRNLLQGRADSTELANIKVWHDPDPDRDLRDSMEDARAWFVGGDFAPQVPAPIPENVVTPEPKDQTPTWAIGSNMKPKEERFTYTHEQIWEMAEKLTVTVEIAKPWVTLPDGRRQGISCFRTFCTDVFDDDDNQIGTIGGGTGFVTLVSGKDSWLMKHSDLWYAFQKALEEK